MANSKFRKVLSLFLAVSMIVSALACLGGTFVSAEAPASGADVGITGVHNGYDFDTPEEGKVESYAQFNSYAYCRVLYKDQQPLSGGVKYIFVVDYNVSNANGGTLTCCTTSLYDYDGNNFKDICSNYTENADPTEYGAYRKTIHFTLNNDITGYRIQMGSGAEEVCTMKVIRPGLYKEAEDGLPKKGNLLRRLMNSSSPWVINCGKNTWWEDESAGVTKEVADAVYWPTDKGPWGTPDGYYDIRYNKKCDALGFDRSTDGIFIAFRLDSTSEAYFPDALEYSKLGESPYDLDPYTGLGNSNTVYAKNGTVHYYNNNRQIKNGSEYELGFECFLVDGSEDDIVAKLLINGDEVEADDTYYDATAHTFQAWFTSEADTPDNTDGALQVVLGAENGGSVLFAKPYLKLYENDDVTGINLLGDVAVKSVNVYSAENPTRTENKKWNIDEGSDNNVKIYDYSSFVPANGVPGYRVIANSKNTVVLNYQDAGSYAAGTYKFVLGCRRYYDDQELAVAIKVGGNAVSGTAVYNDTARTLTYTFDLAAAANGIEISVTANGVYMAVGEPALYLGEGTTSLIKGLNFITYTTEAAADDMWYVSGTHVQTNVPTGFFEENGGDINGYVYVGGTTNHWGFTSFENPYMELKGNSYYYVVIDANLSCTQELFVQFRVGSGYGTKVDSERVQVPNGITKTSEYTSCYKITIWGDKEGLLTCVGCFGGIDWNTICVKDVRIYRQAMDASTPTLINMTEPMNKANTYDNFRDDGYPKSGGAAWGVQDQWHVANYHDYNIVLYIEEDKMEYYFPTGYASYAKRLTNLTNALLGKTYDDNVTVNPALDNGICLIDLVYLKKAAVMYAQFYS